MAYRPPHLRTKPQVQPGQSERQHPHDAAQNASRNGLREDYRDSSQSRSTSKLPSSIQSTDQIKPSRLAELKFDPMEMVQSVSRSGGDGAEGDALKDFGMQDRYRNYIDERIDKHYTTFRSPRHIAPPPRRTEEIESLSSIVLLFRKLREGVVASGRIDEFAIEVFESSAKFAALAKHIPQLNSSLSGLVPGLYHAVEDRKGKGKGKAKATPIDDLVGSLSDLSVGQAEGNNRAQFASILLLLQLVQSESSTSSFQATLLQLTSPPPTRLYAKFTSTSSASRYARSLLPLASLTYAVQASRALSVERFDPMRYFQLLHDERTNSYERIVLSWAEGRVRDRAWQIMKKAYISMKLDWACRWAGEEGDEWVGEKGGTVVEGVVKLR